MAAIALVLALAAFLIFRSKPAPPVQQASQAQIVAEFTKSLTDGKNGQATQQTVSVARVGNYYWAAGIKPWNSGPPAPEYAIFDLAGKQVDSGTLSSGQVDHQNPIKLAYQAFWNLTHLPVQDLPSYFSGLSDLFGGATADLVNRAKQGNPAFQRAQYVQLLKPELVASPGNPVEVGFRCLLVQGRGGVIDERVVVQEEYSGGRWEVTGVRVDRDKRNNVNLGGQPGWVAVLAGGKIQ